MLVLLCVASAGLVLGVAILMFTLIRVRNDWNDSAKRDSTIMMLYLAIGVLFISLIILSIHAIRESQRSNNDCRCPQVQQPICPQHAVAQGDLCLRPGQTLIARCTQ